MPNDIDVNIVGHDRLSPEMEKARRKAESAANQMRVRMGETFKNIGQNILSNVGGPLGSVAAQLANLRTPIGIAAAAVTALAGGFITLSKRAAEATAATSTDSQSFLAGLDNLKQRVSDNANLIGSKLIPAFNSFFELLDLGATKQQKLDAATRAYNESIIKSVASTDEFIKKLNEYLSASDRLNESVLKQNFLKAFAAGDINLANQYLNKLRELKNFGFEIKKLEKEQNVIIKERLATIRDIAKETQEANRQAIREGLERAERALERDRTQFEEDLERQRAALKVDVSSVPETTEEVKEQNRAWEDVAGTISSDIVGALTDALTQARDLNDVAKQLLSTFIRIALQAALASAGVPIPGFANGAIAMQHGSIVRRPTRAIIGEAGPEAVVPLSPNKAPQRQAIMEAAGLGGNSVSLNLNMPNVRNVDTTAIRNELLPAINKQIRRGEKLLASKLR